MLELEMRSGRKPEAFTFEIKSVKLKTTQSESKETHTNRILSLALYFKIDLLLKKRNNQMTFHLFPMHSFDL